jgi:hypothetical protein
MVDIGRYEAKIRLTTGISWNDLVRIVSSSLDMVQHSELRAYDAQMLERVAAHIRTVIADRQKGTQ